MKYVLDASVAISFYDCLYVALAEREGCQFITGDLRLINVLQKDHPLITALDAI